MTASYTGWKPLSKKSCSRCGRLFAPTGPGSKSCLTCNPDTRDCTRCGERYLKHNAHLCIARTA